MAILIVNCDVHYYCIVQIFWMFKTNNIVNPADPFTIFVKQLKNKKIQGYLFCTFAEFFNSAKNSQDCEKWKKTTKITRALSRFWLSTRTSSMGQNLQKWASISQNGSKWAIFSEIQNTISTNSSQWALFCSKWV